MSINLSYVVISEKMCMTFPYDLKDVFREFFKTATWNRASKSFEAAHSPLNLNKWARFIEATKSAQTELLKLEKEEVTAETLEAAAEKARKLLSEIENRIQDSSRRAKLAKEAAEALAPQRKAAEALLAEVLTEAAETEKRLNDALKPVLELYEKHDLTEILKRFRAAASRGYSGKQTFDFAQRSMSALRNDMRSIGYECKAFNELTDVSLNRHDKLPSLLERAEREFKIGVRSYTPELES